MRYKLLPCLSDHRNHIDHSLLNRIAQGDEAAFEILFNTYQQNIYTAALSITRSEELALEILQDTFLKIWLKRETLSEIKDLKAYLFITARNFALEMLRRMAYDRRMKQHVEETTLPFLDPLLDNPLQERRYKQLVQEALQQLPQRQRQVYELMKVQDLKREAVAKLLGIDANTVKAHLGKAMYSIRAYCLARMELPVWLGICFYWMNSIS